jgi:hypothetical protein
MKTFEEKWTAWLDGQLSGKELTEFEASLPDLAAAEAEKRDALRLGAFLKEQLAAQALSNEESLVISCRNGSRVTRKIDIVQHRHGGRFRAWSGPAPRRSRCSSLLRLCS